MKRPVTEAWPAKALVLGLLLLFACGCDKPPKGPETSHSTSEPQEISTRIAPGAGPVIGWEDLLLESYPEPVWITGVDVQVVDENGEELSHSLLDLLTVGWTYPEEHAKRFYPDHQAADVFFRLATPTSKITLPPGYGIPLWSNEPLALRVRWRNTDLYQKKSQASARVTLHFVRDRVLTEPLKAVVPGDLFLPSPLVGRQQYNFTGDWEASPGPPRGTPVSSEVFEDGYQQSFTEEWTVQEDQPEVSFRVTNLRPFLPPGRTVFQTAYGFPPWQSLTLKQGSQEIRLEKKEPAAAVDVEIGEEEEIVKDAFDELRKRELVDTYSLANALMAMEAEASGVGSNSANSSAERSYIVW